MNGFYSFILTGWMIEENLDVDLHGAELIVYAYFYNAAGTNHFRVRTHDVDCYFADIRKWLNALMGSDCYDIEMIINKLMAIGCFEETPDGFKVIDLRAIRENKG